MNVRERKLKRKIRTLQKENERLTEENTFYQKEYERLTAENIYLLMETETLKKTVAKLEGKGKKKVKIKPNTSGKKKKPGRKPGFKGTSRKKPDHVDEVIEVHLRVCPDCGNLLRKPFEITKNYIEDIPPSTATIYNHIKLLSQYYQKEYEEIREHIRKSEAVNADETNWKINGENSLDGVLQ